MLHSISASSFCSWWLSAWCFGPQCSKFVSHDVEDLDYFETWRGYVETQFRIGSINSASYFDECTRWLIWKSSATVWAERPTFPLILSLRSKFPFLCIHIIHVRKNKTMTINQKTGIVFCTHLLSQNHIFVFLPVCAYWAAKTVVPIVFLVQSTIFSEFLSLKW